MRHSKFAWRFQCVMCFVSKISDSFGPHVALVQMVPWWSVDPMGMRPVFIVEIPPWMDHFGNRKRLEIVNLPVLPMFTTSEKVNILLLLDYCYLEKSGTFNRASVTTIWIYLARSPIYSDCDSNTIPWFGASASELFGYLACAHIFGCRRGSRCWSYTHTW